VKIIGLLKIQW